MRVVDWLRKYTGRKSKRTPKPFNQASVAGASPAMRATRRVAAATPGRGDA